MPVVETEGIVTDKKRLVVREWRVTTCTIGQSFPGAFGQTAPCTCVSVPSACRVLFPRPRDQFFEPQPARKSRTSSPGLNSAAGTMFPASAILRLISVKSDFTQPTLETSISPSCAIKKTVGTVVSL